MALYEKLSGNRLTLAQSVARNLQAVLNAKAGYAASVEVYGLGRYDGHYGHQQLLNTLIREMLEKVKAFEPRLRDPVLTLVGRDRELWVRFVLSGRCAETECSFESHFHSVFRQVKVVPA